MHTRCLGGRSRGNALTGAITKRIISTLLMNDALLKNLLQKLRSDIDLAKIHLSAGYYYHSLPFAVTDAVFSIGVRYEAVVRTVHHLARQAGWQVVYRPHGTPYPPTEEQHTMSELLAEFSKVTKSSDAFGNKGYANPASKMPILKADLVKRVAEVLVENEIETFDDFEAFADKQALDQTLCGLPALSSGVVIFYLRMLCGSDDYVKPDRHVHAFIRAASGDSTRVLSNVDAVSLIQAAARCLAAEVGLTHVTPRLLDHAIWRVQSQREPGRHVPNPVSTQPQHSAPQGKASNLHFGVAAALSRGPLSIDDFWPFCVRGGRTPAGLMFQVDELERLHIVSPRSKNKNYRIQKATVSAYLHQAQDVMFRRSHGWFSSVYDFACSQI